MQKLLEKSHFAKFANFNSSKNWFFFIRKINSCKNQQFFTFPSLCLQSNLWISPKFYFAFLQNLILLKFKILKVYLQKLVLSKIKKIFSKFSQKKSIFFKLVFLVTILYISLFSYRLWYCWYFDYWYTNFQTCLALPLRNLWILLEKGPDTNEGRQKFSYRFSKSNHSKLYMTT